ncbi:hypothetical protein ES703_110808 [subsurface metagenome]
MRIEYQYHTHKIIAPGDDNRVYGERIKAGWILKVLTCFLHMPDSKINAVAEINIDQGSRELEIRARARDAAKQGMSTLNPFYVGEYQRIVGHAPDSEEGDEICLTVIGELIPLKKWRKGKV